MTKNVCSTKRQNFLLTLIIAFTMAFVLAFVSACDNSSTSSGSSDSSSSTVNTSFTDSSDINNGSFEYYSFDATLPYTSSTTKWSRTYDYIVGSSTDKSPTSSNSFKSGVIDTDTDAYKALLEYQNFDDTYDYLTLTAEEDQITTDLLGHTFIEKDGKTYSAVKVGDKYYFNPFTPYYYGFTDEISNEDDTDGKITNTKLLMIHNRNTVAKAGTAQYFKYSSTLTLAKGESAKLSVWVNTYGLASQMEDGSYGAYIRVDQSVNSTSLEPLYIKNIDTDGQWAQYTLYFEGSNFSATTFSVYLGLGMGSSEITAEHCEGFAFFDDVTYEVFDEDSTDSYPDTTDVDMYNPTVVKDIHKVDTVAVDRSADVYAVNKVTDTDAARLDFRTEYTYALSYKYDENDNADLLGGTFEQNKDAFKDGKAELSKANEDITNEGSTYRLTAAQMTLAEALTLTGFENGAELDTTKNALVFDFSARGSSYTYTKTVDVAAESYLLYGFWVKADTLFANGITVSVEDLGKTGSTEDDYKASTSIISATNKTENTNTDGWVQYFILINNTTLDADDNGVARTFQLKIVLGPTALTTDINQFPKGKVVLSGFTSYDVDADSLGYISSSVYTQSTLKADLVSADSTSDDTYTTSTDTAAKLEHNLSSYVSMNSNQLTADLPSDKTVSGVFNTQYANGYDAVSVDDFAKLNSLVATGDNTYVQALMINNTEASAFSYSYPKQTLAIGATAKISVKVRAFDAAEAWVYLTDVSTGEIITLKNGDVEYAFARKVTANATGDDEWTTVTFYLKAGEVDAINFRVMISNGIGDVEGIEAASSTGIVVFDSLTVTTSSSDTIASLVTADKAANNANTVVNGSYVIKHVDEDGDAIKMTDADGSDTEIDAFTYVNLDYAYTQDIAAEHTYTLFADFTWSDHETELVIETADDSSTSTSEATSSTTSDSASTSYDKWLYISSLIIAIALIIALIGIIVRMIVKKVRARHKKTTSYYSADSREKAQDAIERRKAKAEKEDYDYDNIDNNVDETDGDANEESFDEQPESTDGEADNADETSEEEGKSETPDDEKKD